MLGLLLSSSNGTRKSCMLPFTRKFLKAAKFSGKSGTKSSFPYCIPWIYAQRSRKGWWALQIQQLKFHFWRKIFFGNCGLASEMEELDIIDNAKVAFQSAVDGIFYHAQPPVKQGIAPSTDTTEAPSNSLEQEPDATLYLRSIFDKELSTFFLTVLDSYKSHHSETCEIVHSISKISNCTIINREIILGATRANMFNLRDCHHDDILGVRYLLKNYDESQPFSKNQEAVMECIQNGDLTVRYTVQFICDEIFCVKDKKSGEVLQGVDTQLSNVCHKIILENTIRYVLDFSADHLISRLPGKADDWIIVDIDNWLGGNKFWTDYPPHYKKFMSIKGMKGDRNYDECEPPIENNEK